MVVRNLYLGLLVFLQFDESATIVNVDVNVCEECERNKFCYVHNSQTKLIQKWVTYMRIYWCL
jgi:hypothetical protein